MKRQLNDEEKRFCEKAVKRCEEELAYQRYIADHANLMIGQGLYQNFLLQLREYEIKRKDANKRQAELQQEIITLKNQIVNGVKSKQQEEK